MIKGYIVETGQGVFGPFTPGERKGVLGIEDALASVHAFILQNFNRLEQPVVIKPLLDPAKLPR